MSAVSTFGPRLRTVLRSQIPKEEDSIQIIIDETISDAFEYDGMTDIKIASNVRKMAVAIKDDNAMNTMMTAALQISFVMPKMNARKAAKLRAGGDLVRQVFDTLTQYQLSPAWVRRVFAKETHALWIEKYAQKSAIAGCWPSWIDQSWLDYAYSGAICCFSPPDRSALVDTMALFAAITSVIYCGGLQDAQKKEAKSKEKDEYVNALSKFGTWAKSRSIVSIQVYSSANGNAEPYSGIVPGSGISHFKRWLCENKVTLHPEYVDTLPTVEPLGPISVEVRFSNKEQIGDYVPVELKRKPVRTGAFGGSPVAETSTTSTSSLST